MTTPRVRARAIPMLAALALLVAAGCRDDQRAPTGPGARVASSVTASQVGEHFYYYQGQPVVLDVDSARLIVASALDAPGAAIGEALSGLVPSGIERLSALRDHWLIHLPRVTQGEFRAALARLRADRRFGFVSQVFRWREDGSSVIPVNDLAVQFKPGVGRGVIDSLVRSLGMSVLREPDPDSGIFAHLLAYPADSEPMAIAAMFGRHPLVEWADPDKVADRRVMDTRTDPYYPLQYYLHNTVYLNGVRVDDNVEPAWDRSKGLGVTVAIIDMGVDGAHEDLCGLGSLLGYDAFWDGRPQGEDAFHPFKLSGAGDFHGTMVAGIINGCHDNAEGIAGIAPAATIVSVRIFRDGGVTSDIRIADGIRWAWNTAHADVLSNSWTRGSYSSAIAAAIDTATTRGRNGLGATVIFSAGNPSNREGGIGECGNPVCGLKWPATLSSVIAVGAIDRNGNLTNYTPEGPELDLVALSSHYTTHQCPGPGDVVTADLMGTYGCNSGQDGSVNSNYTSMFSGTSAAAPQVAGAAALLYARSPSLHAATVRAAILGTAVPWGPANQFGSGKLDVGRLINPPTLSVTMSGPSTVRPNYPCTWTANPTGGVPPYAYSWIPGGAQTSEVTMSFSSSGTLMVSAFDQALQAASASKNITVSPTAPLCQI